MRQPPFLIQGGLDGFKSPTPPQRLAWPRRRHTGYALLTHIRDVKAFVSKVMVFDKPGVSRPVRERCSTQQLVARRYCFYPSFRNKTWSGRHIASLYSARGHAETALGRFEQAKSDLHQAIRLSPRDPLVGLWQVELGDVEIARGNIKATIEQYRKAFDGSYRTYWVYTNLAAVYALDGRMDEAKSALAEARRINPSLTVKWYAEHTMDIPIRSEGLRKAGLPEE